MSTVILLATAVHAGDPGFSARAPLEPAATRRLPTSTRETFMRWNEATLDLSWHLDKGAFKFYRAVKA
jgi:hypothetical protein